MREKGQGKISNLVTESEVENCVIATCGRGSDAGGDRGPRLHVELAGFEGTVDRSVEFRPRQDLCGGRAPHRGGIRSEERSVELAEARARKSGG